MQISGADPEFIEGDVFKMIIQLTSQADTPATTPAEVDSDERTVGFLIFQSYNG